jgi:hypothetical protein
MCSIIAASSAPRPSRRSVQGDSGETLTRRRQASSLPRHPSPLLPRAAPAVAAGALTTKGAGGELAVEAVAAHHGGRAARIFACDSGDRGAAACKLVVLVVWSGGGHVVRPA